jgi:peptidoglycan-N-acetylglucosamine deacetylase
MTAKQRIISPAQATGITLLAIAVLVFFFNPFLAAAIASIYIVLCITASFFPQTNFFLPVIYRGNTGQNWVALTFDDGPADPTTRHILDLLNKYSAPATFFVSGINAARYPEIIKEIIAHGHTIGNHSFHHDIFLMLRGYKTIYQEISTAQKILQQSGVNTLAFRPPVGIVNPKLAPILEKLGMYCLTFSCRAADRGNRRVKDISRKILKKVKADDIILLHDAQPRKKEDEKILLSELELLLSGLKSMGLSVVPLSDLINKQVMITKNSIQH